MVQSCSIDVFQQTMSDFVAPHEQAASNPWHHEHLESVNEEMYTGSAPCSKVYLKHQSYQSMFLSKHPPGISGIR